MTEISRRDLLKVVVPGAWILELRKGGGIGALSTPAKIGFVKDIAWIIAGSGSVLSLLSQERQPKTFKERVLTFRWDQVNSKELENFTNDVAGEYLRLTQTTRVNKNDLVGSARTNYFNGREEMIKAVRVLEPNFTPTPTQWGYTDFGTGKVFIDLGTLREQTGIQARQNNLNPNNTAGIAVLDALWHEWGHVDITESAEGKYINNPQLYFYSPNSNRNEQYRRYRGVEVFTDTYYGFLRFEEVLNETITVRRMFEQVGLEYVFSAADYYQNGIDFFPLFTSVAGIKLDDLYQMHATSDFEGIMNLIGSHLPGTGDPFAKAGRLAVGIHQSNPQLLQQTGVYSLLPKIR